MAEYLCHYDFPKAIIQLPLTSILYHKYSKYSNIIPKRQDISYNEETEDKGNNNQPRNNHGTFTRTVLQQTHRVNIILYINVLIMRISEQEFSCRCLQRHNRTSF